MRLSPNLKPREPFYVFIWFPAPFDISLWYSPFVHHILQSPHPLPPRCSAFISTRPKIYSPLLLFPIVKISENEKDQYICNK